MRAFQSIHRRVSGLLLCQILAGGFAESGRRFFHVKNVIGDLERPANGLPEAAESPHILGACAGAQGSRSNRRANQRRGFRAVNVFEHLLIDRLALCFDIRHLAAHHAVDGARGAGNFREDGGAALRGYRGCSDGLKCQCQKPVTRKNRQGFAKFLVAGRFAAPQVVIVERRQVVVNQRIGMNKLEGACRMQCGTQVA